MQKLRTNDPVVVIAGKHKGKVSTITQIDGDKIFVKEVNVVKRATKGKGFVDTHHSIHRSNVMYYLEKEKKAVRVTIATEKGGKKVRKAVKTGTTL